MEESDIEIASTLPKELPFELSYEDKAESLAQGEIDDFTINLTGLLKKIDFFQWVLRNSHGVHKSTGLPDYSVWWDEVEAIKKDDLVIYRHLPSQIPGGRNVMAYTSQLLNQAATGYLLTNDKTMGEVTEQFCKGITATMKGMLFDEEDALEFLMARNIIPQNHEYKIGSGRKKAVDYSPWRNTKERWNANRIHYVNNPYWGDLYVTNTRSKDDLPHIYRAAAIIKYVIKYAKSKRVINAAIETQEYLKGFCKDIVDNKFRIRTKDEQGRPYIPKGDLASFVCYELPWFQPEKNSKVTTELIANGDYHGSSIGYGYGKVYEWVAIRSHYYNLNLIQGFHMSAILNSQVNGKEKIANSLLKGLKKRSDDLISGKGHSVRNMSNQSWRRDLAVFLLQAGAVGLPLNSEQVSIIHSEYLKAIDFYNKFKRWDLWDESIPDGTYGPNGGYKLTSYDLIPLELIALPLEYCYLNGDDGRVVNPEIIKDMSRWGEE